MRVQAQKINPAGALLITDIDGKKIMFIGCNPESVSEEFFERSHGKSLLQSHTLRIVADDLSDQKPESELKEPEELMISTDQQDLASESNEDKISSEESEQTQLEEAEELKQAEEMNHNSFKKMNTSKNKR